MNTLWSPSNGINDGAPYPVLWEWKVGRLAAPSGRDALQRDRKWRRTAEGHPHHGGLARYRNTDSLTGGSTQTHTLMCGVAVPPAASRGLTHAAHVCYLTAAASFGLFPQKAERLVLLGSSHRWAVLQTSRHIVGFYSIIKSNNYYL